jgi:SNF2 family DNA or RNA helicase
MPVICTLRFGSGDSKASSAGRPVLSHVLLALRNVGCDRSQVRDAEASRRREKRSCLGSGDRHRRRGVFRERAFSVKADATIDMHAFNQRILAEDLVRVRRPDERERYAAAQRQARIDPNPHQIDAVIFALRRLREGGCILADEVGLGKTIEAGLVIAQSRADALSTRSAAPLHEYRPSETLRQRVTTL